MEEIKLQYESFFAPFIRGSILAKTNITWLVQYSSAKIAHNAQTIHITVDPNLCSDEKKLADFFTAQFNEYSFIPCRICITCGENEYVYISAPDFEKLESVKNNSHKENWEIAHIKLTRNEVVKNKIALVTGGAQGFGEEIVRGLIEHGAIVCIADLNGEGAQKLSDTLNSEYKKTVSFPVTVNAADENSVIAMTNEIALQAGGLDVCISNAGVLRASSILEQDIASFKFVTDINYTAFAIVCKHCAHLMKKQSLCAPKWMSDIIQINSKSGLEGSNKNGSYAGSKFGSIGLVQSFAFELITYNIKVNAICPGNFFDGPLWSDPVKGLFVQYLSTGKVAGAKTIAEVKKFYEAKVPMNRGCTGSDVLKAVLYIIDQVYETGQAVPVTGGQVMLN